MLKGKKNHTKIIGKFMAIIIAISGPFIVKMYSNNTVNRFIAFFCFITSCWANSVCNQTENPIDTGLRPQIKDKHGQHAWF